MAGSDERKFDKYQRAAIDTDETAIVSAGAGSGKTTVLSARYLRLVRDRGIPIDSILALTFTKKATSEMFGRIHRDLSKEDSAFVRRQLENFGNARISTFDSFCARIARSGCAAWGFSPDFAVDDGLALELAEAEALAFVLEKRGEGIVRKLIVQHGFERLYREIFAKASLQMCPARPWNFESMPAELEGFLREELGRAREGLSEIRDAALAEGDKKAMAKYAPLFDRQLPEAGSPDFIALCETLAAIRCVPSGQAFHEQSRRIKDEICEPAVVAGRSLAALPEYSGMYALLAEYQERIIAAKRSANVLSFQDSSKTALQVLLSDPELRAFYKDRCQAIMVDEFQDDNAMQRDLLFLIAERHDRMERSVPSSNELCPDKLFFVGDGKQSIYRFRGADVSVFIGLRDELSAAFPDALSLELPCNYRSAPTLVDFFNELFERVMASPERDFEARFSPLVKPPIAFPLAGSVEILEYEKEGNGEEGDDDETPPPIDEDGADRDEPLGAREAEALAVARYIRNGIGTLTVRDGDTVRVAKPDDFAILLRSRTHQADYEKYLRSLGVPFVAQNVRGLFYEAPARDFYQILELVAYPEDRYAYAAVLRSPFANMSDDSAVRLLLAFDGEPFPETPPEGCFATETEEAKYRRARTTYLALTEMADTAPITSAISYLWYDAGYRYRLLRKPVYHPYLDHFDYLYALADRADAESGSLVGFLETLKGYLDSPETADDLDAPREGERGVQIMTIHKSKGLEFPVVIIPECDNKGRNEYLAQPYFYAPGIGIALSTRNAENTSSNCFYDELREENDLQKFAELKRLFYVAVTRAQSRLVLSGSRARNAARGSFFALLDSAFPERSYPSYVKASPIPRATRADVLSGSEVRTDRETAAKVYGSVPILERRIVRIEYPATTVNERCLEFAAPVPRPRPSILRSLPCDALLGEPGERAAFGTLCHAIIEKMLKGEREPFLYQRSVTGPFGEKDFPAIERDAIVLATGFVSSPRGREAMGSSKLRTEYPFRWRFAPAGLVINGQFDLIYETVGRAVVVDFKSDLELVEGQYDVQLEIYRRAASALTGKPVSCVLFYLRESLEIPVAEGFPLEDSLDSLRIGNAL